MSTASLKRELALLRSSLAALTPSQSITLDDPVAWAERIAGLTLDPWQREVLLSAAPRLLLNATRQSGKSTVAALKAAWTVLQGGLAVVVSPSLRQSGFLFRKLTRHLIASDAAFRRETMTCRWMWEGVEDADLRPWPALLHRPRWPASSARARSPRSSISSPACRPRRPLRSACCASPGTIGVSENSSTSPSTSFHSSG